MTTRNVTRRPGQYMPGARRACGVLCGLLLAACQPSLQTDLPTGADAAAAIAIPEPAPGQAREYFLMPGDVLSVDVYREADLSRERVQIDSAGNLALPLIDEVVAAGRSPAELAILVEGAYGARFLRDPQVTIAVVETAARTVAVEGSVVKPGLYEIPPGASLLTAMALAGSPSENAALDEVLVFRRIEGRRAGARFDLTAIRAGRADDPALYAGDVVVVGHSNLRGGLRELLRAAPLFNIFYLF